jgi:hypothetical protein
LRHSSGDMLAAEAYSHSTNPHRIRKREKQIRFFDFVFISRPRLRLAGQPGYLLVTWVQLTQLEVHPEVQPEVQLVVQPVQLVQLEVQLFVQPVQVWHEPPQ